MGRAVIHLELEGQILSLEGIALADVAEINQLNGFLAAAGYVEAAALHGLGDPPFVFNNWTTAAFVVSTLLHSDKTSVKALSVS